MHGNWQRAADLALVAALLAVLGVTAKLLVDPDSLGSGSDTAEVQNGNSDRAQPGKGKAGIRVVNRLNAEGDLRVTQWVQFRAPRKQLPLRNQPATISAANGGTDIRDLTVRASGRKIDHKVAPIASGESSLFQLDTAARAFRLDYVVEGAVQRSLPSASGRALVDINGLTVPKANGPRVIKMTTGQTGTVQSLACSSPSAGIRPCGRAGAKGWLVTLRPGSANDDVVASVDIPDISPASN
jgi:hypothetical protein